MNALIQMSEAIEIARQVQAAARNNAAQMAKFLPGNLDRCDHQTLVKLKTELAKYNLQTKKWKK